ncbi:MAG: hypothetical protein JO209_06690 [Acidisphaera sp.]|nr:hypothetical protein [Acidisphaera sp.]
MRADLLHVVTAIANPMRWQSRLRLYRDFARHMLDSGVRLTTVECAYGDRPHELAGDPHLNHVPVRARTILWNKENLLNIGIARLPQDWKYVAWIDADILFRRPDWAAEAVQALQHYDVIQPWSDCYDLGPNGEHIAHHVSFCRQFFHGRPVVAEGACFWKSGGGAYDYPHTGYAWAATRQAIEWLGGLFDLGSMGSGDHHMALSLVGRADSSMPAGTSACYAHRVRQWQERALRHVNGNIGCTTGTIEHFFHGRKPDRQYTSRWEMFVRHGFDPDGDIKRNVWGVYELAGNKPALRRELDRYFLSRNEDINAL